MADVVTADGMLDAVNFVLRPVVMDYPSDLERYQVCGYEHAKGFAASFDWALCLLSNNPTADCHSEEECAKAIRAAIESCTAAAGNLTLPDIDACFAGQEGTDLLSMARARTFQVFGDELSEPSVVLNSVLDTSMPSSQVLISELCATGISAGACTAIVV